MSQVAIKVENISKRYNLLHKKDNENDSLIAAFSGGLKKMLRPAQNTHEDFWAVKDLSFEINKGDRVGIIGRNGAGKSTLLKILSRIVKPTSGSIEYYGKMASLLEVGTGFHGDLSGRENIYLNGSILGMSKKEIDRRFDEIIAFSEVEQFLDTPVKRYSSGMYVRLAFSVAAHLESDILIVDEVLAVGDAAFQEKCIGKINSTQAEGKTVLFVSHNIGQVAALCNKGIYLEKGRVSYNGSVEEAMNLYLNKSANLNNSYLQFEDKESEFVISGMRLENASGQTTNTFKHDESYCIAVTLKAKKMIGDVVLSIIVNDNKGKRIVSMLLPVSDKMQANSSREFKAKMPASWLLPNEYSVSCAVHIPNLQLFDEHLNVLTYKITDNGSEFFRYSGDLGYVFPKNEWLY